MKKKDYTKDIKAFGELECAEFSRKETIIYFYIEAAITYDRKCSISPTTNS